MKTIFLYAIAVILTASASCFSQVTPAQPTVSQPVPDASSIPLNQPANAAKKPGFNSPQTPSVPGTIPSQDTLIKGQKTPGAVVHDSLMPVQTKKEDSLRMSGDKKGSGELDTTNMKKKRP